MINTTNIDNNSSAELHLKNHLEVSHMIFKADKYITISIGIR